jgi:hypothetical protein
MILFCNNAFITCGSGIPIFSENSFTVICSSIAMVAFFTRLEEVVAVFSLFLMWEIFVAWCGVCGYGLYGWFHPVALYGAGLFPPWYPPGPPLGRVNLPPGAGLYPTGFWWPPWIGAAFGGTYAAPPPGRVNLCPVDQVDLCCGPVVLRGG